MAAEKRRASGELAAWHVLAVRAFLLANNPPPLDALNPYGEPLDSETAAELQRVKDFIAGRRLAVMGGATAELTPDARSAAQAVEAARARDRANDAETTTKVLETLKRIQARGS